MMRGGCKERSNLVPIFLVKVPVGTNRENFREKINLAKKIFGFNKFLKNLYFFPQKTVKKFGEKLSSITDVNEGSEGEVGQRVNNSSGFATGNFV